MNEHIFDFTAWEYTIEETFKKSQYKFVQNNEKIVIYRNDEVYLTLSEGYVILKTILCGICSTDLARKYLPFPLPQVIGHEILAQSIDGKTKYVVEISDSCKSHNEKNFEIFCKSNLSSHCPERFVIGINLLLGGFSPYIIAPVNSIISYNDKVIDDYSAVFVEPLAAALNAIYTAIPKEGDYVAVIGPKKLGALIICGLVSFRNKNKINFKIAAITKNTNLINFLKEIGADEIYIQDSLLNEADKFDFNL
jgi:D-arabinose 1-dehydrogenase-like Zn-dependent alcohol dehydrogenase